MLENGEVVALPVVGIWFRRRGSHCRTWYRCYSRALQVNAHTHHKHNAQACNCQAKEYVLKTLGYGMWTVDPVKPARSAGAERRPRLQYPLLLKACSTAGREKSCDPPSSRNWLPAGSCLPPRRLSRPALPELSSCCVSCREEAHPGVGLATPGGALHPAHCTAGPITSHIRSKHHPVDYCNKSHAWGAAGRQCSR